MLVLANSNDFFVAQLL